MRWLVKFAVWCALASACSTFDSSSNDAPPATTDGGDASEAAAPIDSGALDAADAANEDATDGCVAFELGSTFDDSNAITGWAPVFSNGTIVVTGTLPDGQAPFSAPAALFAQGHVPDGGMNGPRAIVSQTLMFVPSSIHVKYKLSVPSTSTYAQVGCFLRFRDADAGVTTIDFFMDNAVLYGRRDDVDGASEPFVPLAPQPKDWIAIDVTATVDRDAGVVLGSVSGTALAPAGLPTGITHTVIECGIGYADFGGMATSGFDLVEVVIDDLEVRGCK